MMFLHYFIKIVLVVSGFWIISIVEVDSTELDESIATLKKQYLKKSFKDISKQASNPPRNSNSSIQYLLYTPDDPETPCYLEPNKEALDRCPFSPNHPMKIVIHGFLTTLSPGSVFFKIKDKFLELHNFNVIILDWTKYNQPPYAQAAANTLQIGSELANLIVFLQSAKGVDPQTIHLIGHSLGSHVSGVAGGQIPNLRRITGLDPAAPLFYPSTNLHRLSYGDADFVDIIHTSNITLGYGIEDPIGDIDFYPNGGERQPKCQMNDKNPGSQKDAKSLLKTKICNHQAANLYFLHSIDKNECNFFASKCDNYSDFLKGLCSNVSPAKEQMGLPAVPIPGLAPKSKFYLKTSANPPYCLQK